MNSEVTAEAVKNSYLGISKGKAADKMTLCKLVDMHNEMMKSVMAMEPMKSYEVDGLKAGLYIKMRFVVGIKVQPPV